MKKVIVAAAGLMLVGAMASTSMAEVRFSGDARARFYYNNDFTPAIDDETVWKSRVRFQVEADTKGGAYVISRLHIGDGTWGFDNNFTTDAASTSEVTVDKAYVGVPFGPVTVEAGRQTRDTTNFLYYGADVDGIDFNYNTDKTTFVVFYDMTTELVNDADDDDNTNLGAVLVQQFDGGWGLTAAGVYVDDEINSQDGFAGTVKVTGALGSASVAAELAYAADETPFNSTLTTDDDGFGGYASASLPIGPASVTGIIGFTADGYRWDAGDFGPFEMIGGVNIINTGLEPANLGETIFAVLNPSFKATESLTLGAVLAWVGTDMYTTGAEDRDFIEVSGRATYAVTDGAKLIGVLGYLDFDDLPTNPDNAFGAGLSLEVSF